MHARLSTYTGQANELTEGFQRQTDPLEQIEGFSGAYFGVSESGKAFSLTLWDSEDALEKSAERAKELRADATDPSGAQIESVEHFEIAITVGV
jgi:heme-degrading monooxygenase HmoA